MNEQKILKGTTTVGLVCKDGIILAADRRATAGFVVNKKATKKEIKKAVEDMFNVKVEDVNTSVNADGEKRAYVKFSAKNPAIDIATQMGLM